MNQLLLFFFLPRRYHAGGIIPSLEMTWATARKAALEGMSVQGRCTMAGAPVKEIPPYFDVLFTRLENDEDTRLAFGRHVHWGYWTEPSQAAGTARDYASAAEELCRRVCAPAQIRDGLRILDVGCGFGGTLASLNERFRNLDMVGVNIDPRQLERARREVHPTNGNRIRFVEADAGRLPLPSASFDVVLAVECIFHFPDRSAFFAEAGRVLVSGGRLALSDYVPPEEALPILRAYNTSADEAIRRTYGKINVLCALGAYRGLGQASGFSLESAEDISQHIMPTYAFLRRHQRAWKDPVAAKIFDKATAQLELANKTGLLHYTILSFTKRPVALAQSA